MKSRTTSCSGRFGIGDGQAGKESRRRMSSSENEDDSRDSIFSLWRRSVRVLDALGRSVLGTSIIETHRANLMQKLGLHNTAELVLYAVRKKILQV
jgi:DNA-binding CsgD family transcriptional regulator